MKRALTMLPILAVFCMALFANAYASEMFNYYGPEYRGGPVTGDSKVQHWDYGEPYLPSWLTPGQTFGYYGSAPYTEIAPETRYGQAPSWSFEEKDHPTPNSTSGGFGYY